jgi:hypothetical protein
MGSGASAAALLSVNNLEVVYDDVIQVLRGVSLTVPEGKIVACSAPTGRARPRYCWRSRAYSTSAAVNSLTSVDYEGMLPAGAGNYSGTPNEIVVRQSRIAKPDNSAPSGVTEIEPFFVCPTAKEFKLEKPCYQ